MIRLAARMARAGGAAEWTRYALTLLGTAVATGFLLSAVVVLSITGGKECRAGQCAIFGTPPYTSNLLNEPGLRPGVATACVLLVIPVLVFLGQCARVGAAQRDRRLASLRLAGATPAQVLWLVAADTAIVCAAGSVLGLFGFLGLRSAVGAAQGDQRPLSLPTDVALPALPTALVVVVVPVLAGLAAAGALRRVVVTPLGLVRHRRTGRPSAWPILPLGVGIGMMAVPVALAEANLITGDGALIALVTLGVVLTTVGLLAAAAWLSGALAAVIARATRWPALLLAARRLEADPYGQTRALSAVLLCVLFASGAQMLRAQALAIGSGPDAGFYASAYDLVDLAIGVAVVIAAFGLLVASVEAIIERRRSLAALVAVGTPRRTLRRAVLIQAMLPLVPATLLAAGAGAAAGAMFSGSLVDGMSVPWARLAVVVAAAVAAATLSTALAAPVLSQSTRPAELRYE